MNWLKDQELLFEPSTKFEYSNSNFFLLAKIIEKVSGKSYEEFLTQRIFEPLGMNNTGFVDEYDKNVISAKAGKSPTGLEYLEYPGMSFGAGDVVSTAEDLLKWLGELTKPEKVLSEDIISAMSQNRSKPDESMQYGLGLMIGSEGDYIYHAGAVSTFHSTLIADRKDNIQVIVLTNILQNTEPTAMSILETAES